MSTCLKRAFEQFFPINLDHDGSEILWPELPEPYCRRSFHIQEMILAGFKQGYAVTPFWALQTSCPKQSNKPYSIPFDLTTLLAEEEGVITGINGSGVPHALAHRAGDPIPEGFVIEMFWAIVDFFDGCRFD